VLLLRIGFDVIQKEEQALTARALHGLAQIPGLRIYGIKEPDSPSFARKAGVIVFTLKGAMAPKVASELALRGGIGIRFGCHCAHLLVKHILGVGPRLERFQRFLLTLFPKISLPGIARVSLGIENSEVDVDTLIHVLDKIARKPLNLKDSQSPSGNKRTPIHTKTEVKKQMQDFTRDAALRVYSHL
jgi:selenocysteine lyase/cysteine desulfurase